MLHFISCVSGSMFQTVFDAPPDKRLSASTTGVSWVMVNQLGAWFVLGRRGYFDSMSFVDAGPFEWGMLLAARGLVWGLSCFQDGNAPVEFSGTQ